MTSKIEVGLFEKSYENNDNRAGNTLDLMNGTMNRDETSEKEPIEINDVESSEDEITLNDMNGATSPDPVNETNDAISVQETMENNDNELIEGEHAVNDMNGEISDQTNSDQNTADTTSFNLVRIKKEKGVATNANNSGNILMFSPPSTSSNVFSGQLPTHFARLDPSLYNSINSKGKNKSNETHSQMTSIQSMLDHVSLVFPGCFTYVR